MVAQIALPGRGDEARKWLGNRLHMAAPDGARGYLRGILGRVTLLSLYRDLFPKQFKRSNASIRPYSCEMYGERVAYSAKEMEFLELVDLKLFPIAIDMACEWAYEADAPVELIPIQPLQYWCWNCNDYDPDELTPVYKLALSLMRDDERGLIRPSVGGSIPIATVEWQRWPKQFDALDSICRKQRTPLRYLPMACGMVNYDTDNGWLDWCCEQPSEFFWRKEDINWLTAAFKDARKKLDQVAKLDKWLETSTAERMTQAVQLWNRAINQAKKHGKQKPQSDGIRIRTLAEIL